MTHNVFILIYEESEVKKAFDYGNILADNTVADFICTITLENELHIITSDAQIQIRSRCC